MKSAIDVFFAPVTLSDRDLSGRMVVVIDVLRASTTIVTALSNGAKEVLPAQDYGTAGLLAATMNADKRVLGGERDGVAVEGYDLGNSPLDYSESVVSGKSVVLITTNGTPAIMRARQAKHLVIGCLRNAGAVANLIEQLDLQTFLLCSGWKGRASLEDTFCAGLMVDRLFGDALESTAPDSVRMAHTIYRKYRDRIGKELSISSHGRRLVDMGCQDDVEFCMQVDRTDIVPQFEGGRLIVQSVS